MKVLFLGYAVSKEKAERLSGASIAGNKMQLNIIRGLAEQADIQLNVLTIYPVASYPRDRKLGYRRKKEKLGDGIWCTRVSFINLPIIKQLYQVASLLVETIKMADKDTIILAFNQYPQVGIVCRFAKRIVGCNIVSVMADAPINDSMGQNNRLRNLFNRLTEFCIKDCDAIIALNKNIVEKYAPGTVYTVVEGGAEIDESSDFVYNAPTRKNVVYAGALTHYSGILTLMEAMSYIEDTELVLEIYGDGVLRDEIAEASKYRKNIKYYGRVGNKEILEIQKKAFLLVNPRRTDDPIANYTFPSKMFEYMISGTPVLSTKLSGYSDEFLKHIYTTDDNARDMACTLKGLANMSSEEAKKTAEHAFRFIQRNMCWKKQSEKIYHFLEELKNSEVKD